MSHSLEVGFSIIFLKNVFIFRQSNCHLGIYRFADGHNIEGLRDISLGYIHDNFFLVSLEEEFKEINKDLLTQLISSEFLRVDSEYQVFCATMEWINYDISNR